MSVKKGKKKERKVVQVGIVHIQASFNNTIVTITDMTGGTVAWSSAGSQGFKGSRKSTPFAATRAGEAAARKAMENGMRQVDVYVNGPGSGRESAVRALQSAGLRVNLIRDVTPIPPQWVSPSQTTESVEGDKKRNRGRHADIFDKREVAAWPSIQGPSAVCVDGKA